MNCVEASRGPFQLAEPVLEQVVGTVEIGAQTPGCRWPAFAGERLLASGAEELSVDADEEPSGEACVTLVESQLCLERVGQDLDKARHHLQLLCLASRRLLDDARERREAGAAESRAFGRLETPQSVKDRFTSPTARDRGDQRSLTRRHLVEEEILFGREVIVDRLLGDVRGGGDLGDGDVLEAPLRKQLHGPVGDLLPRVQLLRLAQAHAVSVTALLQLQKLFSCCTVVTLSEGRENPC